MSSSRRSPNSRRRANRFRSAMSTDVRARTDWQLGGGIVTPAVPAPAVSVSWGVAIPLIAGAIANSQAVILPEAVTAQNAPPGIGEMRVDEIQGSLFFTFSATGFYAIGVGIFISKFNTSVGSWVIRAASVSTEAMDDDWLFLRVLLLTVSATLTDYTSVEVPLMLPHPVVLGRGEALHVAIDNGAGTVPSAGGAACVPYYRSRISDIS